MQPVNDESASAPLSQQAPEGSGRDAVAAPPSIPEQLLIMKREIDALQIEMAKPEKPWYRQMPVIVAVCALLLSFATTYYAERRSNQQDLHDARVELRQLISQIGELATQNAELTSRYANNPTALQLANSQGNTQMNILVHQAADIVDEISEDVTAAEYFAVASALGSLGNFDPRVRTYYERGITSALDARDVNSYLALVRGLGAGRYAAGDLNEGRKAFARAGAAWDIFTEVSDPARRWYNGFTEVQWAWMELSGRQCALARQHYDRANTTYRQLATNDGWDITIYMPQLKALQQALQRRC